MQDSSSRLNLWKKRLGRVPDSVWQQTEIETLVLAENGLSEVSEQIGCLKRLRMLDLGHNQLTCVPDALGDLDGLTDFLYLHDNQLIFTRSDQYNFIRHGIPALAMGVGATPGSPEQKIFKDWLTQRYHAPSDDLNQPVDLSAAALDEEIIRGLMVAVAQNPQRPQWKPDSFFRRYAQASGE